MSNFVETDLGVSNMAAAELDRIAIQQAGVVGHITDGYNTTKSMEGVVLAGGWSAKWVGTKGLGNCGTLILVGTDQRTKALLREGKIDEMVQEGLDRNLAIRLHQAPVQYKRELVGAIIEIARNPGMIKAMLAAPESFYERRRWIEAWGAVFDSKSPAEYFGISVPRETALVAAIKFMFG